jgi:hypothetical protein
VRGLVATSLLVVAALMSSASADEDPSDAKYALGARIRGVFLPSSMIGLVAQTSSSLTSIAGGAEFIVRKPRYDVVTSLDLMFLDLSDANFLANGRDPAQDTHFVSFGSFGALDFVSMDVSIVGHTAVTRWLELRYGAGVGLGLIVGDVHVINDGRQCTSLNFTNVGKCYPHSANGSVDIPLDQPDAPKKLAATDKPGAVDVTDDPHYHVTADKPPVMVVLNVQLGVRFNVHKHLAFDIDAGFRDAFFVGASIHTLF